MFKNTAGSQTVCLILCFGNIPLDGTTFIRKKENQNQILNIFFE